jgi:uncharacterized membrane protein YdjX (TVP38/TMEM64 family)
MLPGMLPPPMPFKVFVLGAAVFEMKFRDFIVAIFAGRFVRFFVLSMLVLWFGPEIISHFGGVFKHHWMLLSGAILELGLILFLLAQRSKRKSAASNENAANMHESQK